MPNQPLPPSIARSARRPRALLISLIATLTGLVCLAAAPIASAAPAEPALSITSNSWPTNLVPGETNDSLDNVFDQYTVTVTNVGGAPTSAPVTVTDVLSSPLALSSTGADGVLWTGAGESSGNTGQMPCESTGQTVSCTTSDTLAPGQWMEMFVPVDVPDGASGTVTNQYSAAGGGAPQVSGNQETRISASPPAFGFLPGTQGLSESITNADGTEDTQAGSTPYQLSLNMGFPTEQEPGTTTEEGAGNIRDLVTNLPAGMVVNPTAMPECTEAELESDQFGSGCPSDTQVGTVTIGTFTNAPDAQIAPLFNMVPPAGVPAELGFDAHLYNIYVHLMGSVRTGSDYGLSTTSNDILADNPVITVQATVWGDPTDPSHDAMRGACLAPTPVSQPCSVEPATTPFMTMPSACSGPLTTTVQTDSWQNPGDLLSDSVETTDSSGNPVGVNGCDQLAFNPQLTVEPTVSTADSPTGLNVDLQVPQNENSAGLATANLKDATVTLPKGMSVNPASANGLQACTPAQIGIDNTSEPSCPDASKIGTVEVDTPLLATPMTGGIYVAQQNDNPFDSLLAIYVTAEADGALIKLAGHVVADPVTGQLTTTFDNNPQLPFTDFKLEFWGGPGAVLTTPTGCGNYSTDSSLSPWSGTAPVSLTDPFSISSGCVTGFSPSFTAGSVNTQAGAYTPFVLQFGRQDSDQFFSGLTATLPEGVVAKLAGVGECTSAELAVAAAKTGAEEQTDPSCPANSQVGTVQSGAGSGPDPYYLPGKVYLTGPYKGAPFGLAVVVPAVAGPFDLGTVVIRQQLQINTTTAQVTVVSDPFPTILQGIPLQIRSVKVVMNRADFTINPTSCDPMSVNGTLSSTGGLSSDVSSRFQVGGCAALGFSPKLRMALTGKGQTRSADHPTLTATVSQPAGQANISHVRVALPLSLALDPNNSQHVCSYYVAKAVTSGPADCPADSLVGHATAVTPLLSQPLSGPVYLVQGLSFTNGVETHTLPTLLVALRGQIALDLRAQTSVSGGKLVTTFPTIPDAAVSKFTLQISGGKKGILVITGRGRSICGAPQVTDATLGAQSGKQESSKIKMSTPCGAVHKAKKHHKKRHKHKK